MATQLSMADRDRMVVEARPLVKIFLKKFWIRTQDYEEYIAAGELGLVEASRRFEVPEGVDDPAIAKKAFGAYAYWYILRRVVEVLNNTRTIKLTSTRVGRYLSIYIGKVTARILARGEEVTPEVVAKEVNLPVNLVEEILPLFQSTAAKNMMTIGTAGPYDEFSEEMDMVDVADPSPSTEVLVQRREISDQIRKALVEVESGLGPVDVVVLREILEKDDGLTLKEIGEQFGVTKQRIHQRALVLKSRLRERLAGFESEIQCE